MGPIAEALATVFDIVFNMVQILVLASIVVSWVGADPNNQIVQMIHKTTEPLYRPIRRFTSRLPGPFDWAPMALLLIVIFLKVAVVKTLLNMSHM